jgi:hypothetical protein
MPRRIRRRRCLARRTLDLCAALGRKHALDELAVVRTRSELACGKEQDGIADEHADEHETDGNERVRLAALDQHTGSEQCCVLGQWRAEATDQQPCKHERHRTVE